MHFPCLSPGLPVEHLLENPLSGRVSKLIHATNTSPRSRMRCVQGHPMTPHSRRPSPYWKPTGIPTTVSGTSHPPCPAKRGLPLCLAGNVGVVLGIFPPKTTDMPTCQRCVADTTQTMLATLSSVGSSDAVPVSCWHDNLPTCRQKTTKSTIVRYDIMQQSMKSQKRPPPWQSRTPATSSQWVG